MHNLKRKVSTNICNVSSNDTSSPLSRQSLATKLVDTERSNKHYDLTMASNQNCVNGSMQVTGVISHGQPLQTSLAMSSFIDSRNASPYEMQNGLSTSQTPSNMRRFSENIKDQGDDTTAYNLYAHLYSLGANPNASFMSINKNQEFCLSSLGYDEFGQDNYFDVRPDKVI